MRNLTFGVLIVFVGLIAALPFRKSPPPGLTEDALATGPSTGLIVTDQSVSFDPLLVGQDGSGMSDVNAWPHPQRSGSGAVGSAGSLARATANDSGVPGSFASQSIHPQSAARIPSNAQASPRRDLRLPLTYDDLAVPLVTPGYVSNRFDAVAKPPGLRPATDPLAGNRSSGSFESMTVTNAAVPNAAVANTHGVADPAAAPLERFDTRPPSILTPSISQPAPGRNGEQPERVASAKPQVEARLASEGRLASEARQTSEARLTSPASASDPADTRPRHWIRQPD